MARAAAWRMCGAGDIGETGKSVLSTNRTTSVQVKRARLFISLIFQHGRAKRPQTQGVEAEFFLPTTFLQKPSGPESSHISMFIEALPCLRWLSKPGAALLITGIIIRYLIFPVKRREKSTKTTIGRLFTRKSRATRPLPTLPIPDSGLPECGKRPLRRGRKLDLIRGNPNDRLAVASVCSWSMDTHCVPVPARAGSQCGLFCHCSNTRCFNLCGQPRAWRVVPWLVGGGASSQGLGNSKQPSSRRGHTRAHDCAKAWRACSHLDHDAAFFCACYSADTVVSWRYNTGAGQSRPRIVRDCHFYAGFR